MIDIGLGHYLTLGAIVSSSFISCPTSARHPLIITLPARMSLSPSRRDIPKRFAKYTLILMFF